jgi:hypothetical protein
MTIKFQSVSANTLFAAAVGCIIHIILSCLYMLTPLTYLWIASWEEVGSMYAQAFTEMARMFPQIFVAPAVMLAITVLYIISYKKIKKNKKSKSIRLWSTISLVCSFLLIGAQGLLSIVAIFGLVGAISGLMAKDEV